MVVCDYSNVYDYDVGLCYNLQKWLYNVVIQ